MGDLLTEADHLFDDDLAVRRLRTPLAGNVKA
jgi:hypothetical protein